MSRTTDYIAELLDKFEPIIRAAFIAALDDIRSNAELLRIIERLEKGDINGALEAVHLDPAAFRPLEQAIVQAYEAGGSGAVRSMPTLRDPAGSRVVVRFDGRNVRAEAWLRNHSTSIVTGIVEDQAVAIRGALAAGMERGDNPRTVALDVVGRLDRRTGKRAGGIVGLSAQQAQFVENARTELREGTPAALKAYLSRQRRDKRFDRTVAKAIKDGKPIPADQIAAMTQRYADSLLKLRGDTIARTEAMASLHSAQDEAYRQAVDAGGIQEQNVRRVWRSAMDRRVRDSHRHLNGESVGLNESFRTPSGSVLRYPGDPNAPLSEIANCRCTIQVRIDFLANIR